MKYSLIAALAIIFALGATTLYDITIGDDVPQINHLGMFNAKRQLALQSPGRHLVSNWDETQAWDALYEPLLILDDVCPEAADWVRECHYKGILEWEVEQDGTYAKFDYGSRVLTINRVLFCENNGRIASILAHEFRHSRQNFSKFFRATVACSILREPNTSIVEDEAELFEAQVLLAIFE